MSFVIMDQVIQTGMLFKVIFGSVSFAEKDMNFY